MHRILILLFYLSVFLVFSDATYSIDDITKKYPYCLTASKDNRSPSAKEKSDNLKKAFPFTYLGILGHNANDGMDPRYQIKPQPWPRGINQDDQLVDREYELKPLSEGAINEDSKINTDNNNLQSKLVPEDLAFNEGLNLMNNAVETGQNGGLKSRNPLMMSKSKSIRMPKGVINRADDRTRVDLIESGENHSNEENRMPIRSSEEGRIDYKTESQKLSGSVPKTSDTVLASNNVFETKDILQSERRVNGVGTAKRLKSSRYGNHPANFAVNTGCHGNSKTLVNGHNVNAKAGMNMKQVSMSNVQSLISDLFDGAESANPRIDYFKTLDNLHRGVRQKTEKRSADAVHMSHLGDKMYQTYQDFTELKSRAEDSARSPVDHNVCVDHKGEKEPLDKRQKRMLLTRRKKQKHSRKEDKRKQKEEISEKNEEKKKSRKFFKKRKLHKKKQSVVTFKNIKGSEQSLLNNIHDSMNNARCRRGVQCKSPCLYDNMVSLPIEMYFPDPKDPGTSKTLKLSKEKTLDPEDSAISSHLFPTRSDEQFNRKSLSSDIVGFIKSPNMKRKSNIKQVVTHDLNKFDQNTKVNFLDIPDASNFIKMFSSNLSVAAIKTLMNKIDDSTPLPAPLEISFKGKDSNSLGFHTNKDFEMPSRTQDDSMNSATRFVKFIATCATDKDDSKDNENRTSITSKFDVCPSTDLYPLPPFQKLITTCATFTPTKQSPVTNNPYLSTLKVTTTCATLTPSKEPSTTNHQPLSTSKVITTCATLTPTKQPPVTNYQSLSTSKLTTTCATLTPSKEPRTTNHQPLSTSKVTTTRQVTPYTTHDTSGETKNTTVERKETDKVTTPQPRGNLSSPPILDGLCATYKPSSSKDSSMTSKKPDGSTGKEGENAGKNKPDNMIPPSIGTTCKTTITTQVYEAPSKPSNLNTTPLGPKINTTLCENGKNKMTEKQSNALPKSQSQLQQVECPTLFNMSNRAILAPAQITFTDGNKMNSFFTKVKRQALPLNLLPMLLQKDIEQPIQEGQSKKIFLYLYQGNPNDISANAPEGSQFEKPLYPQNYESLTKDNYAIKKLFSPTFEIRFSGKTINSIPSDDNPSEQKNTKLNSSSKYAITIKYPRSSGSIGRLLKIDKTTKENNEAK